MAWFPKAIRKPVARYSAGGRLNRPADPRQRRFQLHTAVSNATSLYPYMSVSGNPVSHFYVRKDGTVEQYIDTAFQSSATLQGNPDTITVETWDGAPAWTGSNVPPWTAQQLASLAELAAWASKVHGIPLALLPDSKGGRSGVCYHRQGVDPWRVSGGQLWSKSRGKVCPGDRRIKQIPAIIAAAKKLTEAPVATAPTFVKYGTAVPLALPPGERVELLPEGKRVACKKGDVWLIEMDVNIEGLPKLATGERPTRVTTYFERPARIGAGNNTIDPHNQTGSRDRAVPADDGQHGAHESCQVRAEADGVLGVFIRHNGKTPLTTSLVQVIATRLANV